MKIKDIPWFNRPGFKLTRKGVHTLDDAELLSIIFWANDKKDDVLGISNKILKKYNLHKLENASYKELVNLVCGKKKAEYSDFVKVMKLLSLVELSKRYNRLMRRGYKEKINSKYLARDIFNRFSDRLRNEKEERFIILMLDNKNKIIGEQLISLGTIDSTIVYHREILKYALKNSASRIILIHNHPTGDPTPSDADRTLSGELFEMSDKLGITMLDHIIIGNDKWWSWREEK
jgi:DNA repair protein RadC